jgi:ribosomal protein S2
MDIYKKLIELGLHLGHHKSHLMNASSSYVLGTRRNYAIIDLNLTWLNLTYSLWFLRKLGELKGNLLFYNSGLVESSLFLRMSLVNMLAIENKFSTAVTKWKHGQLSNFYGQAINILYELQFNIKYKSRYPFKFNYSLSNLLYKLLIFYLSNKLESISWAEHQQRYLKYWRFLHQFKYYNNFSHYPDSFFFICPNNKATPARESVARYLPLITLLDTNSKHQFCSSYGIPSNDDGYTLTVFYYQIFVNSLMLGHYKHMAKYSI